MDVLAPRLYNVLECDLKHESVINPLVVLSALPNLTTFKYVEFKSEHHAYPDLFPDGDLPKFENVKSFTFGYYSLYLKRFLSMFPNLDKLNLVSYKPTASFANSVTDDDACVNIDCLPQLCHLHVRFPVSIHQGLTGDTSRLTVLEIHSPSAAMFFSPEFESLSCMTSLRRLSVRKVTTVDLVRFIVGNMRLKFLSMTVLEVVSTTGRSGSGALRKFVGSCLERHAEILGSDDDNPWSYIVCDHSDSRKRFTRRLGEVLRTDYEVFA